MFRWERDPEGQEDPHQGCRDGKSPLEGYRVRVCSLGGSRVEGQWGNNLWDQFYVKHMREV